MLRALEPEATVDVAHPADADGLPAGAGLADYDGLLWTGSSLSVRDAGDPRVRRQVELVRAALAAERPSFGSCFAVQLVAVATGGSVRANPKGREFGLARKIELSPAGRTHPLFAGKPAVFDAYTSHGDEVETLPPGAEVLASNAWTRVQALAVGSGAASFWAVQYHPEYDLREIAQLARARARVSSARAPSATRPTRPPGPRRSKPWPATPRAPTSPGASPSIATCSTRRCAGRKRATGSSAS